MFLSDGEGVSIARNITDSLHIRLTAPFYWRVENVMKKKGMNIEAAEAYVVDTDECRFNLIQTFLEKKTTNVDHLFDSSINRSSFSLSDAAELIVSMYDKKVGSRLSERKKKMQVI